MGSRQRGSLTAGLSLHVAVAIFYIAALISPLPTSCARLAAASTGISKQVQPERKLLASNGGNSPYLLVSPPPGSQASGNKTLLQKWIGMIKDLEKAGGNPGNSQAPGFMDRYDRLTPVIQINRGANLVLYGDSVISDFKGVRQCPTPNKCYYDGAAGIYDKYFLKYGTKAIFGMSGDNPEGLLWRLQHSHLVPNIKPKVFVVYIGITDVADLPWREWPENAPDNVARKIWAITDWLRSQRPKSAVLMLGILPHAHNTKITDPKVALKQVARPETFSVNWYLKALYAGNTDPLIGYKDCTTSFVKDDHTFRNISLFKGVQTPTGYLPKDFVHFVPDGYDVWATCFKGDVDRLAKVAESRR